jgi:Arc/MetJ-type ribon-helix-helix transcriptional regulator
MISVRLSEEEYSALRELCNATGARSVSDLTRDAMRTLLNGSSRDEMLGARIEEFCTQIKNMDRKIEQLSAELTRSRDAGGNKLLS